MRQAAVSFRPHGAGLAFANRFKIDRGGETANRIFLGALVRKKGNESLINVIAVKAKTENHAIGLISEYADKMTWLFDGRVFRVVDMRTGDLGKKLRLDPQEIDKLRTVFEGDDNSQPLPELVREILLERIYENPALPQR